VVVARAPVKAYMPAVRAAASGMSGSLQTRMQAAVEVIDVQVSSFGAQHSAPAAPHQGGRETTYS